MFGLKGGSLLTYTVSWSAIGHQTSWGATWGVIGTLVKGNSDPVNMVDQLGRLGFESFQIFYWRSLSDTDLARLSEELLPVCSNHDTIVSSLEVFGNPLGDQPEDALTREGIRKAIEHAPDFGARLVTGFAGRVRHRPVTDSIERFKAF